MPTKERRERERIVKTKLTKEQMVLHELQNLGPLTGLEIAIAIQQDFRVSDAGVVAAIWRLIDQGKVATLPPKDGRIEYDVANHGWRRVR